MNDREFELLDRIEESHWWFVGKRKLLNSLLSRDPGRGLLLDLGCGTGGVLRDWMSRRLCVGTDRSELALEICRRRGFGTLVRSDLNDLPFPAGTFDTVLLLDVIEHLDDDVGFLANVARLLAPGGRIVVSVPAFQFLWSQHDETFEHRRRYSAAQLRGVIEAAGLVSERRTYTNALLFPLAAVWRVLSYRLGLGRFAPETDFWSLPGWLNGLLARVYDLEAWLLDRFDLPLGVSLVCIARRREAGESGE
jgi:SAM-dependent methyltransferase